MLTSCCVGIQTTASAHSVIDVLQKGEAQKGWFPLLGTVIWFSCQPLCLLKKHIDVSCRIFEN